MEGIFMQLKTARVFVKDIAAAKSFYEGVLALPLKIDGERHGFCVFHSGGLDLIVESVPPEAPNDDQILVGRFTGLSFTVPDIQSKYTDLLAKGVSFSGPPEEQAWGGTLATFEDPAGNELQLVQERAV
jgi:predicted enzyme related to lactoylglutathione lyase